MYPLARSILFYLDPEKAHASTLWLIRLAGRLAPVRAALRRWYAAPAMPVEAFGLNFINPVGLAAGYDKDGLGWRGLSCLGFGHIEVGTVTPEPQAGNPKPRLFRLQQEGALINRMGFPGRGAGFVARQLQGSRPSGLVLGVNLGINQGTPLELAASDYLELCRIFAPLGDYLVVNISSPNTVGLRRLQARQALEALLASLAGQRRELLPQLGRRVPILVKLAPDLTDPELDDALGAVVQAGMDGVIATNTTISRDGVADSPFCKERGGLSGIPLRDRSTRMVRQIFRHTEGNLPIIGVGGIMTAEDAKEKLEAGASLVQVYTGLVFQGPGLVKKILQGLST